ncbi:hypothetical protein T439DRAFT_316727 [Meredithblackwellia eburnea MCA 4105]
MLLFPLVLSFPLLVVGGAVINDPNNPPVHSESGQYGYNDCVHRGDSPSSLCQTSIIDSLDNFCLFAPPNPNSEIGDTERYEVSWCTAKGNGARLVPEGAITGAHLVRTPHYIQASMRIITGTGDFTKMNIKAGDEGGELDPHGADGNGNPIGGLLLGDVNGQRIQFTEWTQFISSSEFCIRACYPGPDAWRFCQHVYDVMGCQWNMPANYKKGGFDTCLADDPDEPMGAYRMKDGSESTWYQGQNPTPAAQPVPKSSQCVSQGTVGGVGYGKVSLFSA